MITEQDLRFEGLPKNQTIGVIGGGFVGKAVARGFLEHAKEVRVYDVEKTRATHGLRETWESDFVFICVPTPAGQDGKPNCSIVTEAFGAFSKLLLEWDATKLKPVAVIRSTVRPGFTAYMQRLMVSVAKSSGQLPVGVVHSPEFLTARCAHTDFATPARNIIGRVPLREFREHPEKAESISRMLDGDGYNGQEAESASANAAERLRKLYAHRFPGVPVQMMTSTESELTKIALNSFFAVKVDFFNMLKCICDSADANFDTVLGGMLSDGRVAHAHTKAPGPDGLPGFGGTCLPKDLLNLFTFAEKMGVRADLLFAANAHNLFLRGKFDSTLPRPELAAKFLAFYAEKQGKSPEYSESEVKAAKIAGVKWEAVQDTRTRQQYEADRAQPE